MIEDPIALVLLLITGIVALIVAIFLFKDYMLNKKPFHALWGISLLVLFVSGVLIILNGFEVLAEPLVPVVAALIPACLAVGIVFAVWPEEKYGLIFLVYALVVIVLLALAKLNILLGDLSSIILMAVHIPSGLIITLVPIWTALTKKTDMASIAFGLGGLFISLGGILLAFATVPTLTPILTLTEIFGVLPLLLLIVGVLFVVGILYTSDWKVPVPFLVK
ncbi:MAG: hypothetical protein ACTSW1_15910 [Candidatus Hodarchaeales archaeon]